MPVLLDGERFREEFPAEGLHIEFKSGLGARPIQEVTTAFSNADGGVVIFGVNDSGEPTGQSLSDRSIDSIHEAIREVRNPGHFSLNWLQVDNNRVIVLSVAPCSEGIAQTSRGQVLSRQGSSNTPLFGAALTELVVRRRQGSYEHDVSPTPTSAVTESRRQALQEVLGWDTWDDASAEGLGFQAGDRLTMSGVLILGDESTPGFPPKAHIEYLRYDSEGDDYTSRRVFRGPLDRQVIDATEYVSDQVGTELVVVGVHRHELPRIPKEVLREAIGNAVAHRNYEYPVTTKIEHRPRSIRVISPGSLVAPVTVDNIRHAQASRNPGILGMLRRFGLAEDIGRGVDFIEDSMADELLEPPRFEDDGHQVKLTLSLTGPVTARERAWLRELQTYGMIEPSDRVLVISAARGERLTNSLARDLLNTEDASVARGALQRLRDLGMLEQSGERGATAYRLSGSITPPGSLRLPETALEALVLDHASEAPLTNGVVRDLTGLDRAEALRLLRRLVESGELEQRGERRGTHYVLPNTLEF